MGRPIMDQNHRSTLSGPLPPRINSACDAQIALSEIMSPSLKLLITDKGLATPDAEKSMWIYGRLREYGSDPGWGFELSQLSTYNLWGDLNFSSKWIRMG